MKKIIFSSILALSLIYCSENKSENKPIIKNAVDNADSSVKSSFESGRRENMIHEIYNELMKNDKNLQALDDKIDNVDEETEKVTSQYNDVIDKTENYYTDANALTAAISDTILKQEINKDIKASSEKYQIKTKRIKDLIEEVSKNRVKLHDQYVIFQIKKTLPEIEKYQNAHPLKTDSLNNFINKQNQLLNELKNLK
ncbi:hypothetical protein [Chryseobacterium limigenitum]|uniref:Cell-wall binding lipoprotein n=1 Tax=Chryseobacterium limigenitum TaxID=1612149 RepID=A0A1K2IC85_9FLAO|nr:hypothetical protein [Chryseobacterium limigenitum]SFZ90037.1 hypothetical protein SAMN05216324_101181 [Chryseobacterium limigenitum]